ncbi:MAG: ATP-binding protein [Armatimonadota bacterium]|nr:ATP-binding protein [Armatimonadota bacterium]MDR7448770.1 ATP-binding protein [Armatimonadota bacterium]MDR7459241.1 ATP-binding protein [Armatimonadota bacterium]MDR7479658.1 ATP-binding protein [Armatimonadota bacterium]MDR7487795.1 ATP-binding protein [Armatimonadota bacterium]
MEGPANGTPTHSHPSVGSDNEWTTIFEDVAGQVPFQAIRAEIYRRAREAGFAEQAAWDLAMAVHEAVANAATHGSPSRQEDLVRVQHRVRRGVFECRTTSRHLAWELPPPGRPSSLSRPGLGFFLIRTFVDEVVLDKDSGRSELTLRRKIPR